MGRSDPFLFPLPFACCPNQNQSDERNHESGYDLALVKNPCQDASRREQDSDLAQGGCDMLSVAFRICSITSFIHCVLEHTRPAIPALESENRRVLNAIEEEFETLRQSHPVQ